MLKVESIQNGIVIDHITAGKGMEIYRLLDLEASAMERDMKNDQHLRETVSDIIKNVKA